MRHNRSTPEEVVIPQRLRGLARLRRVRDRIDREYAQPRRRVRISASA
ncbi:MAG: hypothetical protein ACRDV2_14805 [Actinomycetes bacterium]